MHHGFKHEDVFLSAGVQLMVRSDIGASGVLFTLDTESGFRDVVFITSSYGLGENVVQGAVNPDEFYVYKPTLRAGKPAILRRTLGAKAIRMVYSDVPGERVRNEDTPAADCASGSAIDDADVEELARQALMIEEHYGRPMDIEWAKDGDSGKLYIVQARPETVKSRARATQIERYQLGERGPCSPKAAAIGQKIGSGKARVDAHRSPKWNSVQPGDVLVADMTDPDWEPIMKRAAAIVTNRGGRTCHAAIIARELGVPAVVGCGNALDAIPDGSDVTVSCAEGDTGSIYEGMLNSSASRADLGNMPPAPLEDHDERRQPRARVRLRAAAEPGRRPGAPGVHHRAPDRRASEGAARIRPPAARDRRSRSRPLIAGYADPVSSTSTGSPKASRRSTAAFAPNPVIVRLSDFKSNEYANLIGGAQLRAARGKPDDRVPRRLALRRSELRRLLRARMPRGEKVREKMGLTNCWVMIPFVRTLDEGRKVIEVLAEERPASAARTASRSS